MKNKIIITDFDKTLTDYDTTLPFAIFCAKKTGTTILLPPFFILMILSKLKIITVQYQKEKLLEWFCFGNSLAFDYLCKAFANTIALNALGKKISKNSKIIITSSSFKNYVQSVFPEHTVLATEILADTDNNIQGLKSYSTNENKAFAIRNIGIDRIDEFYTNSITDLPMDIITKTVYCCRKGEIIKTQYK